jgi:hypothetical protein
MFIADDILVAESFGHISKSDFKSLKIGIRMRLQSKFGAPALQHLMTGLTDYQIDEYFCMTSSILPIAKSTLNLHD